jgi:hypothetical protein
LVQVKDTNCSLLQVLVADKIVAAASHSLNLLNSFIDDLSNPASCSQIRDIELEFVCGIANDVSLYSVL